MGRNLRVALEKTKSVSSGLSDPSPAKMRRNLAERRERSHVFSRDNLTFQGDKAQLISGSGWLIIRRCVDGENSRTEIISDSGGTTAQK